MYIYRKYIEIMKIENSRIVRSRLDSRKVLLGFLQNLYRVSGGSYVNVNAHITTKITELNLRKDICKKTLELFGVIQSSADGSKFKYTDELPTMDVVLGFTKFLNDRRENAMKSKAVKGDYSLKKVRSVVKPLTGSTKSFVANETQLSMEFDNLLSNCADEQPVLNLNKKYADQLDFVRYDIKNSIDAHAKQININRLQIDKLTAEIKQLGNLNRDLNTKLIEFQDTLNSLDKHERVKFCLEYGKSEYKKRYNEEFDMSLVKFADLDLSAFI